MTFDELVNEILTQQDSVTHYNERGDIKSMHLHQHHRAKAVQALIDWTKEQIAAEREACIHDVCVACADGVRLEFRERPDGSVRPRPPAWIHLWGSGMWTVCPAAGIHEHAREREKVEVRR